MNSLDLWYFDLSAILPKEFFDLLSTEERLRAQRISHSETKRRFLAGRGLLRSVLREYEKTENLDVRINHFGRPFLATSIWVRDFNLSHTEDLVVLAVTTHGRVGIDLELGHSAEFLEWSQKEAALKYSGTTTLDEKGPEAPFLQSFSLSLKDRLYFLSIAHDGPREINSCHMASWSARHGVLPLRPVGGKHLQSAQSVYLY